MSPETLVVVSTLSALDQIRPQCINTLPDHGIVLVAQSGSCQHNDIQTGQCLLLASKGFSDQPFEPVALDSEFDILLADDQPQSGNGKLVVDGKDQNGAAGNLVASVFENGLEVGSIQ